jgi:hypothetical protein
VITTTKTVFSNSGKHFYHKKYGFEIFDGPTSSAKAQKLQDLVIDATIIPQTTYFLTLEDIVGTNSAGVVRYNWAQNEKNKICHTHWSPKLPTEISKERNRPSNAPEYFLEHVTYSRNILVSSGFHGKILVADLTN